MRIPFVDLKSQYAALKPEIDAVVLSVMSRGAFIMGPEHDRFETAFAAYVGGRHCAAVSNGTDALELAIMACGLGEGAEVIVPANTFIATAEAVTHAGGRVRFVDVDPHTYTMDPGLLERAITPQTKAVIPVHLYGVSADMDPILAIARRHGLKVIEDCAQAHGARYKGRVVGTFGDVACFSFYPGKNLGAYGDGGAIVTNDAEIFDRVKLLRNHGQSARYVHAIEGYCRRLDNLQAAVLEIKLPHLDAWNAARRQAAAEYTRRLTALSGIVTPFVPDYAEPVFHLYVIRTAARDEVRAALAEADIECGMHYPLPLHEQPAYAYLGHAPDDFPVSHEHGPLLLSLPIFPELQIDQIEQVVGAVQRRLAVV